MDHKRDLPDFCPLWGVWQAEKRLGSGSFGTVWKMRREEMGQVYYAAVKHISIPRSEDEVEQLRSEGVISDEVSTAKYYEQLASSIMKEINTMNSLKGHTNIVSCEDYMIQPKENSAGYDLFIRMELLTSLDEWRRQHGLRQEDVIRLGVDVATAIEVLNRKGLVHRDVKPQNILVNDMGDYKLADFGTARMLGDMTMAMSVKGTYNYMAPEVFRSEPANHTVDIYSLGMVLYWLTNNSRGPFLPADGSVLTAETREMALHRRMRGEPLPPPAYGDAALHQVILRACAYNPKERYQSGAELREALLRIGRPTPPPSPPHDPSSDDTVPTPPPVKPVEPEKPEKPEKPAKPASGRAKWIAAVAAIVVVLGIGAALLGGGRKPPQPTESPLMKIIGTPTPKIETVTPTPKIETVTPTPTATPTPSPTPVKKAATVTATSQGVQPLAAISDFTEYTAGSFRYMIADDGTAHITGYSQTTASSLAAIPTTLDGRTVSAIAGHAFVDATFAGVSIPDTLFHVHPEAFVNCWNLESFTVSGDHPTLVVRDNALIDKQTNTLIKYPAASLRRIYTIPEGVEAIGPQGFAYCQDLFSLTLPRSLQRIEDTAFLVCWKLAYIEVAKDHPVFASQDSYLYNKQDGTLVWHMQGLGETACTVPDFITAIGADAFREDLNLRSVTLPAGVTDIGEAAFHHLHKLESVTLQPGLKRIGKSAFGHLTALQSMVLPEGLEELGDFAFFRCENLQSLNVPASVTAIGKQAFDECPKLTVTVEENSYAHRYCLVNNVPFLLAKAQDAPTATPASVSGKITVTPLATISDHTEHVSGNWRYMIAEDGSAHLVGYESMETLQLLTLPETLDGLPVTAISVSAFPGVTIERIEIPDTLLHVDESAFSNVSTVGFIVSETHPTLRSDGGALIDREKQMLLHYPSQLYRSYYRVPEDVKVIGSSAFSNCWFLNTLYLPDGLEKIYEGALNNCSNLTAIHLSESHPRFRVQDGVLLDRETGTLLFYLNNEKVTEYVIPTYVKRIGNAAFSLNDQLTSLFVPSSVREIGDTALFGMQKLERLYLSEGLETIGHQGLSNMPLLTSVTLPEGLKTLSGYTFLHNPTLQEVIVPASVETLGWGVFDACPNLTVTVTKGSPAHQYCIDKDVPYKIR